MKAAIRGTEIYFDVAGMQIAPTPKGFVERPVLFMLHGGPGGDHLRYKQHSLALQNVAQLIFIDHRGCGQSKKTQAKDYTLENNIEDIEALRKHLGLEKICVLGTSYGGMVAQGYAIRYPKHVSKLILVATAPSYRFITEAKNNLMRHGTPKQIAIAENLWKGNFKNSKDVGLYLKLMDSLYSVSAHKRTQTTGKIKSVWSHEAINEGFGNFLRKFNFIPKLKRIKCPTLVLAGNNDWICPPSQSKTIAQHIPQADLKIFKNCGHSIGLDAPQAYLKSIKKFLTDTGN